MRSVEGTVRRTLSFVLRFARCSTGRSLAKVGLGGGGGGNLGGEGGVICVGRERGRGTKWSEVWN